MLKPFKVPSSNKLHKLRLNARDYIKFSNNVIDLNVVEQLQSNMIDKSQIKSFSAGSNVSSLSPSCFIGCENLAEVSFKQSMKSIGSYAFYGCTSLGQLSSLSMKKCGVSNIGDLAFARSGLQDVKLNLYQSDNEDSQVGSQVFASCANLDSFEFVGSNYSGSEMFKDCSSLTSVAFAKSNTSFDDGTFANCKALENLQLPKDISYMPDNFAAGCTSLNDVKFIEPGDLGQQRSLGGHIFDGSTITSITFPASLTSFNCFSEDTLAGMDDLVEIHLNGITYSQIAQSTIPQQQQEEPQPQPQPQPQKTEYPLNKLYCDKHGYNKIRDNKPSTLDMSAIDEFAVKKDKSELLEMMTYAINNNIPVVGMKSQESCPKCNNFCKNTICSTEFIEQITSNNKYFYVFGNAFMTGQIVIDGKKTQLQGGLVPNPGDTMPKGFLYWKKSDGTVLKDSKTAINQLKPPSEFFNWINGVFGATTTTSYHLAADDTQYALNKIYCNSSTKKYLSNRGMNSNIMSSIVKDISTLDVNVVQLMQYCIDNNIQITLFRTSTDGECGNCNSVASAMHSSEIVQLIQSNNKYMIFFLDKDNMQLTINGNKKAFYQFVGLPASGLKYVVCEQIWNKSDGTLLTNKKTGITNIDEIKDVIEGFPADDVDEDQQQDQQQNQQQDQSKDQSIVIEDYIASITSTGCFGLNHDVLIYPSDGGCISFKAGQPGSDGSLQYNTNVQVDKITENDFRYGQWYSKARLLHDYAVENCIPVLAIATQGSTYEDSNVFNESVFDDPLFQQAAINKNIFLCKVDSPMFNGGDASYLLNDWMSNATVKKIPLFMIYWFRKNMHVGIEDDELGDVVIQEYAYFSRDPSNEAIGACQCVHNVEEAIAWLNGISIFSQYVPQDKFMRPTIQSFLSQYPKYLMYSNQANDTYGRYFPVAKLNAPAEGETYDVSVNNSSGQQAAYSLIVGSTTAASLPPQGTYQYFSLLSDDANSSMYDMMYDISGYIFKIGRDATRTLMKNESFEYSTKTIEAYEEQYNIVESNIEQQQSSFMKYMYMYDDDGNPTTEFDPEYIKDMDFLWNTKASIKLNEPIHITVDGQEKDVNDIQLWLSSQAQVVDDPDPDFDGQKMIIPGDIQYVVSSQMFGEIYSNERLQWLSVFNNMSYGYSLYSQSVPQAQQQQDQDDSQPQQQDSIQPSTPKSNTPSTMPEQVAVPEESWWKDYYSKNKFIAAYRKYTKPIVKNRRAPFGDPIVLGQWNGYLEQCSAIASEYGIPMIAVYSSWLYGGDPAVYRGEHQGEAGRGGRHLRRYRSGYDQFHEPRGRAHLRGSRVPAALRSGRHKSPQAVQGGRRCLQGQSGRGIPGADLQGGLRDLRVRVGGGRKSYCDRRAGSQ